MAEARHGMCELTRHGMAGERHGHGMVLALKVILPHGEQTCFMYLSKQ
jgi:hypothetical protein